MTIPARRNPTTRRPSAAPLPPAARRTAPPAGADPRGIVGHRGIRACPPNLAGFPVATLAVLPIPKPVQLPVTAPVATPDLLRLRILIAPALPVPRRAARGAGARSLPLGQRGRRDARGAGPHLPRGRAAPRAGGAS